MEDARTILDHMVQQTVTAVHVARLPDVDDMKQGTVYICDEFLVTSHLCFCGCGERVVLAIDPAGYKYSEEHGKPSLRPAIGNIGLPCGSCYRIHDGRIVLF